MFDIFGSPDHLTETGVATNTTAPIKVAPIKNIFCIVVLLNKDTRVVLNHSANQLFELSRCKCLLICGCCLIKIEQWKSAVVFKIEHPAHTRSGLAFVLQDIRSRPRSGSPCRQRVCGRGLPPMCQSPQASRRNARGVASISFSRASR